MNNGPSIKLRKKLNIDKKTSEDSEINLKVASLLKQAEYVLQSKRTLPCYKKLIPSFVRIFRHYFFHSEVDVYLNSITNSMVDDSMCHDLVRMLENIRLYNDKLEAFSDIATLSGEVNV